MIWFTLKVKLFIIYLFIFYFLEIYFYEKKSNTLRVDVEDIYIPYNGKKPEKNNIK